MTLHLYNSLTRQNEVFQPLDTNSVTMYVCGPTVYDTPHLGNARPAVVFDVLYRVLKSMFNKVAYARNFTDIDDKIMLRAKENNESIRSLTDRTIAEYHSIMDALNVLRPDYEPRATDTIPEMISMIRTLLENGHAYEAEGHVLFDINSHPEHGLLSKHDQHHLQAGTRVEPAPYKRNQSDFVLWKPSVGDQPGWESPFGFGRPGWHIECSAMIKQTLGTTIDIHGGGGDLRFPHHDSEISQSQCANHAPLANYWLHNGMVLINGNKMAKSTGNFITPRQELSNGIEGDVLRLNLLSSHYRQPLDWTPASVDAAKRALDSWRNALLPYKGRVSPATNTADNPVLRALQEDLNTPMAIARLHEMAKQINKVSDNAQAASEMMGSLRLMGLLADITDAESGESEEVMSLLAQREDARKSRNYVLSDRLREELLKAGIMVRDEKEKTVWWRI